jgi:outer membrane immunogenic protein
MGQVFDRSYFEYGGTYAVPSFGAGLGGHAGYDWQDDTFVYGVIADFAFFNNDESDSVDGYRAIESSLNFRSTLRGRAGVATGQGLIFATAGVAYADIELNHQYIPGPDVDSFFFDSDRFGWTAGLGVEKAMSDNSSFKFEVLYTSFGKEDANNADLDECSGPFATELCTMEGHDDTITASVGYSWRWGK